MQKTFGGGPQIALPIVSNAGMMKDNVMQMGGYEGGYPDRNPQVLTVKSRSFTNSQDEVSILASANMTLREFTAAFGDLFDTNIEYMQFFVCKEHSTRNPR